MCGRHGGGLLCSPEMNVRRAMMVGDNMETDIVFGRQSGMRTVLVETGVHAEGDVLRYDVGPDYVLSSFAAVL